MKITTLTIYIFIISLLMIPITSEAKANASKAQSFIQELSQEAIKLIQNSDGNELT